MTNVTATCACGCGETIASVDVRGRPRIYRRGHNVRVNQQPGFTFAGRTLSPESRALLSAAHSVPKPYLRGAANGMAGRTGESNPNYRDGSSPERQRLYSSGEGRAILRAVYARDGYRCTRCGAPKQGPKTLHAHHVKPWSTHPELRFDLENLVTLCRTCHHDAHRKGVSSQNGVVPG